MLDEGAGKYNALDLADAVEFLGASLTTASSFDSSVVNLHTPASKLDQALPLLADVALRPTFPQNEIDRIRKERLAALLQARDNPAAVAAAGFARLAVRRRPSLRHADDGHRVVEHRHYTPTTCGVSTRRNYQPQNAGLIVVGDVTPASVLPKLQQAFGSLEERGAVVQARARAGRANRAARQIFLIDKPGAAQSQIRIGGIGVARMTPDYFVLDVLNTMLGGSFSSRLNQNLREEHGYCVRRRIGLRHAPSAGPFYATAGVQTDKTVESLVEFFKELDGMRAPPPAGELTRVRNLLALGFPGRVRDDGQHGREADRVVRLRPGGLVLWRVRAEDPGRLGRRDRARLASSTSRATASPWLSSATCRRSRSRSATRTSDLCRVVAMDEVLR